MELSTQTNRKTLYKAQKEHALTQTRKGMHRLNEGMTRFVRHNARTIRFVALGGASLLVAGRWVSMQRRPRHSRALALLARTSAPFVSAKSRSRRALKSAQRRLGSRPAASTAGLIGAGALIGSGLAMLLAPRFFMGVQPQHSR